MPNVDLHKSPGQWGALVAAAALFWGVIWGIGSQFRDHLLADVDARIASHSDKARSNRDDFFRKIESEAHAAIGRITAIEQHCATIRDWRTGVDSQLSGLQDWRGRCGAKLERFSQYVESDSQNIAEIKRQVERLQDRIERRAP